MVPVKARVQMKRVMMRARTRTRMMMMMTIIRTRTTVKLTVKTNSTIMSVVKREVLFVGKCFVLGPLHLAN